jgi:hypothetical protein
MLTYRKYRSANLSPAIGHIGHIAGVMESPQSDSSAPLSPDDPLPTPTVTTTPDSLFGRPMPLLEDSA